MKRFSEMNEPEMLAECRDDASAWAAAFQEIVVDGGVTIDADLMFGWFANAIEYSYQVRTGSAPVVLPDGSAFFVAQI